MLAEKYLYMYLVNVITSPLYEYEYQFAICESCFWCATIFYIATEQRQAHLGNSTNNNNNLRQQVCSTCKNKNISLIPLAKDERYTIAMESKRGVEMEFAKLSR
jgi:hypothetical protein